MTDRQLINLAREASKAAYAPYSKFKVGAALECSDGTVYTGCNVENSSLGCTLCAERIAVGKAVSEGYTSFIRLAVFSESTNYCTPCGICRQVLSEFSPELEVLCAKSDGRYVSYKLKTMLPFAFDSHHII